MSFPPRRGGRVGSVNGGSAGNDGLWWSHEETEGAAMEGKDVIVVGLSLEEQLLLKEKKGLLLRKEKLLLGRVLLLAATDTATAG